PLLRRMGAIPVRSSLGREKGVVRRPPSGQKSPTLRKKEAGQESEKVRFCRFATGLNFQWGMRPLHVSEAQRLGGPKSTRRVRLTSPAVALSSPLGRRRNDHGSPSQQFALTTRALAP